MDDHLPGIGWIVGRLAAGDVAEGVDIPLAALGIDYPAIPRDGRQDDQRIEFSAVVGICPDDNSLTGALRFADDAGIGAVDNVAGLGEGRRCAPVTKARAEQQNVEARFTMMVMINLTCRRAGRLGFDRLAGSARPHGRSHAKDRGR